MSHSVRQYSDLTLISCWNQPKDHTPLFPELFDPTKIIQIVLYSSS